MFAESRPGCMYVQPMMPPRPPLTIAKLSDNFGQYVLTLKCACGHVAQRPAQNAGRTRRMGRAARFGRKANAMFTLRQTPMHRNGTSRHKT